jgi:hypothetical protein
MSRLRSARRHAAIALSALLLAACGGGGAGGSAPTTGQLVVRMHDSPIEAADHVYVTIESVEVFKTVDGAEVRETLTSTPGQYDLLELQHGVEAVIGGASFAPGTYHSIRLLVAKDSKHDLRTLPPETLKNYIVVDGTPYPLVVPSGHETGIKLGRTFTIEAGVTTVLTLDFDVRKSVHRCGRTHVYRLRPRIKVVPTEVEGQTGLAGTVSTTDGTGLPSGTVVSAQQNGAEVASVQPDGTGSYVFSGLADGTYDLIAIAPGYTFATAAGVVVAGGSAAGSQDLSVAPTDTGVVYGVVTPTSDDVTVVLLWNGFVVSTVGVDPSTGDYVSDALPPGDYTVVATDASTSATASGSATIVGAGATALNLGL